MKARYSLLLAALLVVLALSSCSGSVLEDAYAWPSYLPDGVTVIGECVMPGEMVGISSPAEILADPAARGVAILISPWEEWYGYDSADDFGRSFVPELPNGSVLTIDVRDTEGIAFNHQPVFTDKSATSVAWRESEMVVYVTGLGLELEEVTAVAEGLRPSSVDRFPGCASYDDFHEELTKSGAGADSGSGQGSWLIAHSP